MAIDYSRAFAAYKVGAEGGDASSQYQLGIIYDEGSGVPQDYKQARVWWEKAETQDYPAAVHQLGVLYFNGHGVIPSWRRAREYLKRATKLGSSKARENMDIVNRNIQQVTASPINKT